MSNPDFDSLLNSLLPFAQQQLKEHGEFFPFGASLNKEGNVELAMAQPDETEQPQSQQVIDLLNDGFRNRASQKEITASGICFDSRVSLPDMEKPTDAICIALEHSSDEALEIYVPYTKGMFGKIKYGDLLATKGTKTIFA